MLRAATSTSLRSPNAGSNWWLRSRSRITLSAAALRCGSGREPTHAEERTAAGHEIAHRGHQLQNAVGFLGDVHEHVVWKLVTTP